MSTGSFSQRVGSRASITLFATDLTAHQHLVTVEYYPGSGSVGARFSDGSGVEAAIVGDRSSVAMIMASVLAQLRPPDPDPDPPAEFQQDPADPGSSLPEVEGGEAA